MTAPWLARPRRPYIVAEIGVNHDGSVGRALELVDAAASAGADAVKLQFFRTDLLLSGAAKLASYQRAAGEADPAAMLRRLELSIDELARVADRARSRGLDPIVTVFSVALVADAERVDWAVYKTASPDIVHKPLLDALAATGRPMIVSTGAATMEEVRRAVGWLAPARDRLALLQCVSAYPTPIEHAALGGVVALREEFGVPIGYSDHTREVETGARATDAGAEILEKHLTHSRSAAGPDHAASLEPAQFAIYAQRARQAALAPAGVSRTEPGGAGVSRTEPSGTGVSPVRSEHAFEKAVQPIERDVRLRSRQSLVAARALAAGDRIARADLTVKRPGDGIGPWRLEETIGRVAARAIHADTPITEDDLA